MKKSETHKHQRYAVFWSSSLVKCSSTEHKPQSQATAAGIELRTKGYGNGLESWGIQEGNTHSHPLAYLRDNWRGGGGADDPEAIQMLLVMEFVEGGPVQSADAALHHRLLPESMACDFLRDAAHVRPPPPPPVGLFACPPSLFLKSVNQN